ncbi:hypothetical protein IAT40_005067 [Kwoniella sp. CBS 6097]
MLTFDVAQQLFKAQSIYISQLCIPLIFGFPTKFKQEDTGPGRMCPRCNNVGGGSRTWFEFFWIPLIPFSKTRIWVCTICQWEMKMGDGPDPQPPGAFNQGHGQYQYGHQQGMMSPSGGAGGYNPHAPPPPSGGR